MGTVKSGSGLYELGLIQDGHGEADALRTFRIGENQLEGSLNSFVKSSDQYVPPTRRAGE